MTPPPWYAALSARRADPAAIVELGARFLAAPPAEREAVRAAWDEREAWATPDPWRLACAADRPGSAAERVTAALVHQALALGTGDERDAIVSLAILWNSAELAGLDPDALFERVAAAFPGKQGASLRRFAARRPEDRSLAAFLLSAVPDPGGGAWIRRDW